MDKSTGPNNAPQLALLTHDVNENLDGTREFLDMTTMTGKGLVLCAVQCKPTPVKLIKCDL